MFPLILCLCLAAPVPAEKPPPPMPTISTAVEEAWVRAELLRFGPRESVMTRYEAARQNSRVLYELAAETPWQVRDNCWGQAQKEALWHEAFWEHLAYAHLYPQAGRGHLEKLREMLGDADYYDGRLPAPGPTWRARKVEGRCR